MDSNRVSEVSVGAGETFGGIMNEKSLASGSIEVLGTCGSKSFSVSYLLSAGMTT